MSPDMFFIIDELEIAVGHFQLVHFYHGALLYILYSSSERKKKNIELFINVGHMY